MYYLGSSRAFVHPDVDTDPATSMTYLGGLDFPSAVVTDITGLLMSSPVKWFGFNAGNDREDYSLIFDASVSAKGKYTSPKLNRGIPSGAATTAILTALQSIGWRRDAVGAHVAK